MNDSEGENDNDIAFRWLARKFNGLFTLSGGKNQKKFSHVSFRLWLNVNENLIYVRQTKSWYAQVITLWASGEVCRLRLIYTDSEGENNISYRFQMAHSEIQWAIYTEWRQRSKEIFAVSFTFTQCEWIMYTECDRSESETLFFKIFEFMLGSMYFIDTLHTTRERASTRDGCSHSRRQIRPSNGFIIKSKWLCSPSLSVNSLLTVTPFGATYLLVRVNW